MNKLATIICIPLVMFLYFEASFLSHTTLGLVYVFGTRKERNVSDNN